MLNHPHVPGRPGRRALRPAAVLAADQGAASRALADPEQARFADRAWEQGRDGAVFLRGAVT